MLRVLCNILCDLDLVNGSPPKPFDVVTLNSVGA